MNGLVIAAILMTAAFALTFWVGWYSFYEPSPVKAWVIFFAWALPLFYSGGWAFGYGIGETTGTLLVLIFFGFLGWFRSEAPFWGEKLGASIRAERTKNLNNAAEFSHEVGEPPRIQNQDSEGFIATEELR